MTSAYKIAVFAGDGIGKEIVPEAVRVLQAVSNKYNIGVETREALVGGSAIDAFGIPLPEDSLRLAPGSDAALLGLREKLGLFANLRPAKLFSALADASTLKRSVIEGIDIVVMRELTGGIYFGKPRGIEKIDGQERGINTEVYTPSK